MAIDVNLLLYASDRGNLVPDAHLVALMLEHDVPLLYTNDSDFKKFSSIRVRNPLTP